MTSTILQPHLAGDPVRLDPLIETDWTELYAVASDPLLWAGHPANDRWEKPVFEAFFSQALLSGGALTARNPSNGAVIGSSRYSRERVLPGEVEIGWTFLARALWGGQVNAAMKRLMIDHALHHFDRVMFIVGENNGRSRRAMEKIGAKLTDQKLDVTMGERVVGHVKYSMDRGQFDGGPLSER